MRRRLFTLALAIWVGSLPGLASADRDDDAIAAQAAARACSSARAPSSWSTT